jgi:hypothetical protein
MADAGKVVTAADATRSAVPDPALRGVFCGSRR